MKSLSFIIGATLLASVAFSAPHPANRLARRLSSQRHRSNPHIPSVRSTAGDDAPAEDEAASNTQYSQNWAGAVLSAPPSGQSFTAVSATFTIPMPTLPPNAESGVVYASAAWVGIDGDTYGDAILQTGVTIEVQDNEVAYSCWYEWYPNYSEDFSGITLTAGDVVIASVHSFSPSEGVARIINQNTGVTVSKKLSSPSSSNNLAGQNAEWIVEDFAEGGNLVPFANFNTVSFSNAVAKTSGGQKVGPEGATIIDMESYMGGPEEASAAVSGSEVTVTYG